MSDTVEITVETIDPETALVWLEGNTHNRPAKVGEVTHLASEMKGGHFQFNGDTIRFDKNKKLLDGQHRLLACVEANTSFKSIVVKNLPNDVFKTIDVGRKRSHADTLALVGVKNYGIVASALILVDNYVTKRLHRKYRITNERILELLQEHPDVVHYVFNTDRYFSQAIGCALHYMMADKDPELASMFFEQLVNGNNISEADPVGVLRKKLIRNYGATEKLPRSHIFALIIKGWNATRSGKTIKQLSYLGASRERYPVIL